ncbi:MAG TPA: hypothetical protein VE913_02195, partial [Longimicrobium sp.]|nr:hypothetical protein [Longimicrobium sp.]
FLMQHFERFPFTGLTMLALKNESRDGVLADLQQLIDAPGVDTVEGARRREMLELYRNTECGEVIEFTTRSMERRR